MFSVTQKHWPQNILIFLRVIEWHPFHSMSIFNEIYCSCFSSDAQTCCGQPVLPFPFFCSKISVGGRPWNENMVEKQVENCVYYFCGIHLTVRLICFYLQNTKKDKMSLPSRSFNKNNHSIYIVFLNTFSDRYNINRRKQWGESYGLIIINFEQ